MKLTGAGSYVLLAPCFGTTGWQVMVFTRDGRCIFGSAHPTRAEAARERRRLIYSLDAKKRIRKRSPARPGPAAHGVKRR